MAKKARAVASATAIKSEILAVRPVVEATDSTIIEYVNFAEIAHSQHEFSILCVRVPTKPNAAAIGEAKKTGALELNATLQLLLPPTIIPGLIRALGIQKDAYEARFGPITGEPKS